MFHVDPTKLCQIEIKVTDLKKSVHFYNKAFGWAPSPLEIHDTIVLQVPDRCTFGISLIPKTSDEKNVSLSTLYFQSPNPKEVIKRVQDYGGKSIGKPINLPSYGTIYIIEDPDGQRYGLLKAT